MSKPVLPATAVAIPEVDPVSIPVDGIAGTVRVVTPLVVVLVKVVKAPNAVVPPAVPSNSMMYLWVGVAEVSVTLNESVISNVPLRPVKSVLVPPVGVALVNPESVRDPPFGIFRYSSSVTVN